MAASLGSTWWQYLCCFLRWRPRGQAPVIGTAVFFTPAIVSGTADMPPYRFAFWNLLDSLGWSLSVAASAYGVGRLATGHNTWRDIVILIIGLGTGALVIVAVRRRRRRRARPPAADGAGALDK